MIADLQTLPTGVTLTADLCIVGSGPAGLTLASACAQAGHTVLLLEAGGFDDEPATQTLYAGQVVGRAYPVQSSRARMFGGTSGRWTGQCGVLPARHMRERPWVAASGWPISPDELTPYFRKASHLLELGNIDRDAARAEALTRQLALPAEGPLVPFVWRARLDGPLRFGTRMRHAMSEASTITVVLHANVTRLKTNNTATQVSEVQFSTIDGKTGTARARYFVLACGGLETPRLLLDTDDVQSEGLGNDRGLVGRNFMEHPNGVIGTLSLANVRAAETIGMFGHFARDAGPPAGLWKPALCLGDAVERGQKINAGYYRFYGREARWPSEWAQWRGAATLRQRLHVMARLFDERLHGAYREAHGLPMSEMAFPDNEAHVFVEFEQAPNPDSRVTLTRERDRLGMRRLALDWRLSEQDIRTARALGEACGREAYLSGWGRFQFADWVLAEGVERSPQFRISYHHMGTARMARDPQFGVVDSQCQVFGCENLYIAGSAVFPTTSFVNPTLTIVALAYRLADTLDQRLK